MTDDKLDREELRKSMMTTWPDDDIGREIIAKYDRAFPPPKTPGPTPGPWSDGDGGGRIFSALVRREFWRLVTARAYNCPTERPGQVMMNVLWDINPNLRDEVRNTDADCFYDDANIPAFCTWLEAR